MFRKSGYPEEVDKYYGSVVPLDLDLTSDSEEIKKEITDAIARVSEGQRLIIDSLSSLPASDNKERDEIVKSYIMRRLQMAAYFAQMMMLPTVKDFGALLLDGPASEADTDAAQRKNYLLSQIQKYLDSSAKIKEYMPSGVVAEYIEKHGVDKVFINEAGKGLAAANTHGFVVNSPFSTQESVMESVCHYEITPANARKEAAGEPSKCAGCDQYKQGCLHVELGKVLIGFLDEIQKQLNIREPVRALRALLGAHGASEHADAKAFMELFRGSETDGKDGKK